MDTDSKSALKRLYDEYADEIYRYARFSLNNISEAEDVVQEVFVRAFKGWKGFRQDSSERTWLMSIARNYIFDLLRKRQTDRQYISDIQQPLVSSEQVDLETMMMLEELISSLKEDYRHVFTLRHVEDLSVKQVSEILRWSQGKVRITDHRAVSKLRQMVNGKEVQRYNGFKTEH